MKKKPETSTILDLLEYFKYLKSVGFLAMAVIVFGFRCRYAMQRRLA